MKRLLILLFTVAVLAPGMVIAPPPASAAVGDELLFNPGFEASDGGSPALPLYWTASSWGVGLTATASYPTDGHSGTHSVRVDVDVSARTTEGDAKWIPTAAVDVRGGAYYTFSDWYKSDTSSAVSVYFERAGDLPDEGIWANLYAGIPPASQWTRYTTGFTMPPDAVKAYFVHFIAHTGYLQTDDYSMREMASPPGFSRSMVSLTFDDGSKGFYDNARGLLNAKGYKTTQYIPTLGLGTGDTFMMTPAQVREVAQEGHEIGSHTIKHPHLTTLPAAELAQELAGSKASLEAIPGIPAVTHFAYPFGEYDARVIAAEKAAGYTSGRSVEVGYNTKGDLEPYDIRVQNITSATTGDEFQGWLDYAKAHNYWLVIVYHEVQPGDATVGEYDTTVSGFRDQLDRIAASGLGPAVMPVGAALRIAEAEIAAAPPPAASTADSAPTAPPTPASGAIGRPSPAARVTAVLTMPRQRLHGVLAHGLRVVTSSSRAGTRRIQLVVSGTTARRLGLGRRPTAVGVATILTGAGRRTVAVRFSARAQRALARARSVSLSVRLRVAAGDGRTASTSSRITLR